MKPNFEARRAASGDVNKVVYKAVSGALYTTLYWAVDWDVHWDVYWAVDEDPPHPGLQDFLGEIGGTW